MQKNINMYTLGSLTSWWLRWLRVCLQCRRSRLDPWVGKILWTGKWQPTPVLLPGKSHGQRSMVGYIQGVAESRHNWVTSLSLSFLGSLVSEMVKNLLVMQETQVPSLGWEDALEKGMATHSSVPVWRIPWTEEPGGFQSIGSQRVSHNWVTNIFTFLFPFHTLLPFFVWGKKERERWELDYIFVFVFTQ